MDVLAPFRIPVTSLKSDEALFHWDLGPEFFRIFDEEHDAEKGRFSVDLNLAYTGSITTLQFHINGVVETPCDRCLAPIEMPIHGDYELIVKFGDPKETTEEVLVVDPESGGLNVGSHIYDFVLLAIPISRKIPGCETSANPPCDMVVLDYLSKTNTTDETPGEENPLWKDLNKIIDN